MILAGFGFDSAPPREKGPSAVLARILARSLATPYCRRIALTLILINSWRFLVVLSNSMNNVYSRSWLSRSARA